MTAVVIACKPVAPAEAKALKPIPNKATAAPATAKAVETTNSAAPKAAICNANCPKIADTPPATNNAAPRAKIPVTNWVRLMEPKAAIGVTSIVRPADSTINPAPTSANWAPERSLEAIPTSASATPSPIRPWVKLCQLIAPRTVIGATNKLNPVANKINPAPEVIVPAPFTIFENATISNNATAIPARPWIIVPRLRLPIIAIAPAMIVKPVATAINPNETPGFNPVPLISFTNTTTSAKATARPNKPCTNDPKSIDPNTAIAPARISIPAANTVNPVAVPSTCPLILLRAVKAATMMTIDPARPINAVAIPTGSIVDRTLTANETTKIALAKAVIPIAA